MPSSLSKDNKKRFRTCRKRRKATGRTGARRSGRAASHRPGDQASFDFRQHGPDAHAERGVPKTSCYTKIKSADHFFTLSFQLTTAYHNLRKCPVTILLQSECIVSRILTYPNAKRPIRAKKGTDHENLRNHQGRICPLYREYAAGPPGDSGAGAGQPRHVCAGPVPPGAVRGVFGHRARRKPCY